MWRYTINRVLLAIVTVFIVITLTFFTMNAVPGGPFSKEKATDPAVQRVLEERYKLDRPLGEQFVYYLQNLAKGNFGVSLKSGREISSEILGSFAVSAKIGGMAALLALALGLVLGTVAALNRNRWPDRFIVFLTTALVSVPSFVLATLLLLIFSQTLRWVPVFNVNNPNYILPVISLGMYPMAYITRLTKSSMLDVLGQDYMRTARAKGVLPLKVVFKHGLRNAILPVVTYTGPMLAFILTGSLVVETVFTIGGLGTKFISSITNRDYTMIMGTTIFLAVLMVFLNLISDLVYKLVDPRIKFS